MAAIWAAGESLGGGSWLGGGGSFAVAKRADGVIELGFELVIELLIFGDDPLAQVWTHVGKAFGTCGDLLGHVLGNALSLARFATTQRCALFRFPRPIEAMRTTTASVAIRLAAMVDRSIRCSGGCDGFTSISIWLACPAAAAAGFAELACRRDAEILRPGCGADRPAVRPRAPAAGAWLGFCGCGCGIAVGLARFAPAFLFASRSCLMITKTSATSPTRISPMSTASRGWNESHDDHTICYFRCGPLAVAIAPRIFVSACTFCSL